MAYDYRVLGGSAQVMYDVSNETAWKMLGGAAIPIYIVGTGPLIIEPPPDDAILTSVTDWLLENATDYIRFE